MELREQVDTCRSAPPGDWITVPLRQVAAHGARARRDDRRGARSMPAVGALHAFKRGARCAKTEVRRTPLAHRMHAAVTTARRARANEVRHHHANG